MKYNKNHLTTGSLIWHMYIIQIKTHVKKLHKRLFHCKNCNFKFNYNYERKKIMEIKQLICCIPFRCGALVLSFLYINALSPLSETPASLPDM